MIKPLALSAPVFAILLFLGACAISLLDVPASPPMTRPSPLSDTVDARGWPLDLIYVGFRVGTTIQDKRRILVEVGATEIVGGVPVPDMDGLYLVRIHPPRALFEELGELADELEAVAQVESAEPLAIPEPAGGRLAPASDPEDFEEAS